MGTLTKKFFSKKYSKATQDKFRFWLINSHDPEIAKDMDELWKAAPKGKEDESSPEYERLMNRIYSWERKRHSAARGLAIAASIVLVAVLSVSTTYFLTRRKVNSIIAGNELQQIVVPNGEYLSSSLPDGTKVTLGAGSTLVYPKSFVSAERQVFLSGKALFEVAVDKAHPFVVNTKEWSVTALGTVFDVTAYPDARISSTTLLSGRTKVNLLNASEEGAYKEYFIEPDQQLTYDRESGRVSILKVNSTQKLSWTKGYQVFEKASFSEIISALQRYYDVRIVCDNISKMRGQYNVKFFPDESITDVLDILCNVDVGFTYKEVDGVIYIHIK